MNSFETQILNYMDAAFPILYLHTFEEGKAKDAVRHVLQSSPNTQALEWDGTDRVCDLLTGTMKYDLSMYTLADILDDRMSYIEELKSVAGGYGYTAEEIDELLITGCTPEEIEDMLYCGG